MFGSQTRTQPFRDRSKLDKTNKTLGLPDFKSFEPIIQFEVGHFCVQLDSSSGCVFGI